MKTTISLWHRNNYERLFTLIPMNEIQCNQFSSDALYKQR